MTCRVNPDYLGEIYFYRENQLMNSHQLVTKDNIGTFLATSESQGGRYQCKYGAYTKTRWFESQFSKSVIVTIVVPLTVPEISLDQSNGVYSRGATVKMTCTVNRQYIGTIYFYRNKQLLNSRQLFTKDNIGMFKVTSMSQGGRYQCKYKTVVNRRRFRSQFSEPVAITIAGLPKPYISMDSSRALMGREVTFNCTSPRYHPGLTFYLYKLGDSNYLKAQVATARFNSVTFTIMKINHTNEGNYTCLYEVDRKRRRLTSALSNLVHFTVKDKSAGLEAGIGSTLTVILTLALLGVCFWKRGMSKSRNEMSRLREMWRKELDAVLNLQTQSRGNNGQQVTV
ncbi:uncharacterized protein LOC119954503 isoform X1 [Scyliorhinus canicula]|uniref:uncharacterized protein LOC119954503 isoform X1 n=1 Tax=Scyliorhinus canicula TaxID=7830 RepID=UPI0018F63FF7|nr:uncharacterized protein LOC119954503 isoform X1 [Scyliorhinus canicula]